MVSKKDTNSLLDVLQRICTDFQAMERLLDHHAQEGAPAWRRLLPDSRKAVQGAVQEKLEAIRDILRSDLSNDEQFALLIEALDELTLPSMK